MSSQDIYKKLGEKLEKTHPVAAGETMSNSQIEEIKKQIAELRDRVSRIEEMLSHKTKGILGEIHNILHG